MPRSILQFSIWNFNYPNIYAHTYICSMVFSRTFWGLYWSVVNSHITVGACRRLVPFIPRLLPVSVHVPFATTVEKIANITRYSHIESWNAWLGRTTVRLRWTASTCKYCIPVNHTMLVWSLPVHLHQALPQSRLPSPGLCDDTTQVRYLWSPHPDTTTMNCYFRGTDVHLVPAAAYEGCIAKHGR